MSESDPIIELVQLDNGDIVLRSSDKPQEPLVTISISNNVENLLSGDRMEIASAMVEAGIESYQEIQFRRTEELRTVQESGFLH